MNRSQIKEGMVFGIPFPDGRFGIVQLIKRQKPIFYMAGFDLTVATPESPLLKSLDSDGILFLGNFFDDLIKTDQWIYLGSAPVAKDIPFPQTRVMIDGKWVVETWDGRCVGEMPESELSKFPLRSNHGGALMQEALLNRFGFIDADPYVSKYLPEIQANFVRSISGKAVNN